VSELGGVRRLLCLSYVLPIILPFAIIPDPFPVKLVYSYCIRTNNHTDLLALLLHQLRHHDAPNPRHPASLRPRRRPESLSQFILVLDVD
jgi:hypothetical protein